MTLFISVINNYMSYIAKVIYTRPNAEVSLHTPTAEYTDLIDNYFSSGKITEKPTKSEDGLTTTWKTTFNTEDDFNEFIDEKVSKINSYTRETHCSDNSISYSLESE